MPSISMERPCSKEIHLHLNALAAIDDVANIDRDVPVIDDDTARFEGRRADRNPQQICNFRVSIADGEGLMRFRQRDIVHRIDSN